MLGGVVGLGCASFLQLLTVSTMNFASFSQLSFGFQLTPKIVTQSMLFAVIMGMIGGFLPSLRAARMEIVDALPRNPSGKVLKTELRERFGDTSVS